uniref:ISXO2-like transposase domain-containing protein n=1 Tax=Octopus bimaculoides TaxID=37653 RepID=A0A0L8FJP7_OCTBM
MVSASSDSDFEGFTIDDIENINENKSILSLDESDIDISDFSLDEEDFNNESCRMKVSIRKETWLEDICAQWCIDNLVEIDESKFMHRKYHRGRYREGHWVLGMVERRSLRCVLVPVENRSAATLLPIIAKHVVPGTKIITDCWRAYNSLQNHSTINHRDTFVDPNAATIHTNTVEGMWIVALKQSIGRCMEHPIDNCGVFNFENAHLPASFDLLLLSSQIKLLAGLWTERDKLPKSFSDIVEEWRASDAIYHSSMSQVLVLMQLVLSSLVFVASSERTFSALRHLKTWLRTTMTQHRLTHCAIMHVHKKYTMKTLCTSS